MGKLETKKREREREGNERHFGKMPPELKLPSFSLTQTMSPILSPLLFIFFLISITMPNHQAPKTLNFRSAQLENPGVSLSYHQTNPMMRNRGKFRDNPTWFRFIRAVIRAPKRESRPSRATLLLVASNPPQIASKFVAPSTNHEFKSMGERLGRI